MSSSFDNISICILLGSFSFSTEISDFGSLMLGIQNVNMKYNDCDVVVYNYNKDYKVEEIESCYRNMIHDCDLICWIYIGGY